MELEAITRQEKIIAGQDLTPITRMEMFLKNFGGGGGGGGVTTLHINVTAINTETKEATFTADKTPLEMQQASATGPTWCVVSFEAGVLDAEFISIGIHPAWAVFDPAFGLVIRRGHGDDGNNQIIYAVRGGPSGKWVLDLNAFDLKAFQS